MNLLQTIVFTLSITKWSSFTAASPALDAPKEEQGRLIGGVTSAPHRYPYMVSLQLRFLWVRAHFCGGSLLNQNWVLTAGHCVTESWLVRWLNVDAVAGAHNVDVFSKDVQIQPVVQRIEHPNYMGGIGPNDIAMLRTRRPFVFTNAVLPARLPLPDVDFARGFLAVAGWGALNTNSFIPRLPSLLQELKVTYVPYEKCFRQLEVLLKSARETNPLNNRSNICTGPLNGGTAACVGDSGGPLIFSYNTQNQNNESQSTNSNIVSEPISNTTITTNTTETRRTKAKIVHRSKEYLVGVVSWGVSPCGEIGAPTVYTDVTKQLDFIKSYINT